MMPIKYLTIVGPDTTYKVLRVDSLGTNPTSVDGSVVATCNSVAQAILIRDFYNATLPA